MKRKRTYFCVWRNVRIIENPNFWRKIQITGKMSRLLKNPNYWKMSGFYKNPNYCRNVRIIEKSKLFKKCSDY
jgi:hypothetical protein